MRSYHQRAGKMTSTQARGLADGLPRYAVPDEPLVLDLAQIFDGRSVVLDIGFGMGESVVELTSDHPELGVLGLEVHDRGIGQLLAAVLDADSSNVRVARADAAEFLRDRVPPESLMGVRLFFPDPWPKKRHHKRRLVQPAWANLVASRLVAGGYLHCATDWEDYGRHMREVLDDEAGLVRRDDLVDEYRSSRPTTKYERIGLDRGHIVTELVYLRG